MVKAIILFRSGTQTLEYGERYNNFLMSLETLPGLRKKAVNTVYAGPGGLAPYRAVIEIYFDDRPSLEAALTSPEGVRSGHMLLDFAGPDAITLFADVMEEAYDTQSPAAES